jgi:hypothetical protein
MGNNCTRNEQRPETYEKNLSTENDETKGELIKQKNCKDTVEVSKSNSF